jgi:hypothetical protein
MNAFLKIKLTRVNTGEHRELFAGFYGAVLNTAKHFTCFVFSITV